MSRSSLMDRLRKKAEEAEKRKEERQSFGDEAWFKPEEGDNRLRILPHWKKPDDEFFFVERVIHYVPVKKDDGTTYNAPVRCLRDLKNKEGKPAPKSCPYCNAFDEIRASDPKSKLLRDLRVTRRALYNIINYGLKGKPVEPKLEMWACPETVHEDILQWIGDLDEFWQLDEGRNWRVRKSIDKKRGPLLGTSYKVYPDMKDSSLSAKLRPMVEELPNLDGIWPEEPVDRLNAGLELLGLEEYSMWAELADDDKPKKKKISKKVVVEDEVEDEEYDEEDDEEEVEKPKKKSLKKKSKKVVDDEDDDEDDEEEVEKPKKKSLKKKSKKVVDDDEDDDEEKEKPKKSFKKKSKKADLDDDLGLEDDELEDELRDLGI